MREFVREIVFTGRSTWTSAWGFITFFIAGTLTRLWSGSSTLAVIGGFLIGCVVAVIAYRVESPHGL